MYRIVLMPKAKADLVTITAYLSKFYESTPKKFIEEFEKTLEILSFSPWYMKWEKNTDYRKFFVRRYMVLYQVDEVTLTVYIHRIVNGMLNLRSDIEVMEDRKVYDMKKTRKHIYGPIRSRRLGNSLGVDMVPHKTCSLDCVYCECGATTVHTMERREYIDTDSIINEIDDYLSGSPPPDYVTFGGSGEPTLHSGLGRIIKHLKERFPSQKLALLTNSTLLGDRGLREEILPCDLILPSLDAVTDKVFREINVPVAGIDCAGIIDALIALSAEYHGQMWLEVFIAPGINDTDSEIVLFKEAIARINPARVQLNSLDRKGTCETLAPAPIELLDGIARRLEPLPVEIVAKMNR